MPNPFYAGDSEDPRAYRGCPAARCRRPPATADTEQATYDPGYPVCLHVYGRGAVYYDCSYYTLPQCNASASGRAAQCVINPYYAYAEQPPVRRYKHRRVY